MSINYCRSSKGTEQSKLIKKLKVETTSVTNGAASVLNNVIDIDKEDNKEARKKLDRLHDFWWDKSNSHHDHSFVGSYHCSNNSILPTNKYCKMFHQQC